MEKSGMQGLSVPGRHFFARAQAVLSAAIWTNSMARARHPQIHLGVPAPKCDARLRVGAGNIALVVKILGLEFDDFLAHCVHGRLGEEEI